MNRNQIVDWKNKELLIQIIKESKTQTEVLNKLGLNNGCGNNQTFLKYIKKYEIDITHLKNREYMRLAKENRSMNLSNELFFISDKKRVTDQTKKRLLKCYLKQNKCDECNHEGIWHGQELKLQIDHIDGNKVNNTIDNLRLLCPNCHTQTLTFNRKKR